MANHDHFELRRASDDLIYQFDRVSRNDGSEGYKRRDLDLWIVLHPDYGWVAIDDDGQVTGRPWTILSQDQGDYPPEGEWVSKKGPKSYVYNLVYVSGS